MLDLLPPPSKDLSSAPASSSLFCDLQGFHISRETFVSLENLVIRKYALQNLSTVNRNMQV